MAGLRCFVFANPKTVARTDVTETTGFGGQLAIVTSTVRLLETAAITILNGRFNEKLQ